MIFRSPCTPFTMRRVTVSNSRLTRDSMAMRDFNFCVVTKETSPLIIFLKKRGSIFEMVMMLSGVRMTSSVLRSRSNFGGMIFTYT